MNSLPQEILFQIFRYLPSAEVPRFVRLSKHIGASLQRHGVYFERPSINVELCVSCLKKLVFTVRTPFYNHILNIELFGRATFSVTKNSKLVTGRAPEVWNEDSQESSLKRCLQRMKENSANLYRKWGKPVDRTPTIPILTLKSSQLHYFDTKQRRMMVALLKEMECFIEIIHIETIPQGPAFDFAIALTTEKICSKMRYEYFQPIWTLYPHNLILLARECEEFHVFTPTYFLAMAFILEIEALWRRPYDESTHLAPYSLRISFPKKRYDVNNKKFYLNQLKKFGVEIRKPVDLTKSPKDIPPNVTFRNSRNPTQQFCCNFVERSGDWIVDINGVL